MIQLLDSLEENGAAEEKPRERVSLDTAAFLLADLDRESYQRDLLRDAESVLSNVTFPMSFPWNAPVMMVPRNVARDIDELSPIITIDDRPEYGDFGRASDPHQHRSKKSLSAYMTAHRSDEDPGVIKLTTKIPLSLAQTEMIESINFQPNTMTWSNELGDFGMQMYRRVKTREELESRFLHDNTDIAYISLRLRGSSTRRHLVSVEKASDFSPLLLRALLPEEVREGRRLKTDEAMEVAVDLGSYDVRFNSAKNSRLSSQAVAGRVRKIWVKKGGRKHRPDYKSIVTGESMDGSYLRPRRVALQIRVNGHIVGFQKSQLAAGSVQSIIDINQSVLKWCKTTSTSTQEPNTLFPTLLIHHAVDEATAKINRSDESEQTRIRYVYDAAKKGSGPAPTFQQDPFHVDLKTVGSIDVGLDVVPPTFQLVNVADNFPYLVCSSPGTLKDKNACSSILQIKCWGSSCSICFKTTPEKCLKCDSCDDVLVHKSCYGFPPEWTESDGWECDQCRLKRTQDYARSRWCGYCNHKGGGCMSTNAYGSLVHHACMSKYFVAAGFFPFCARFSHIEVWSDQPRGRDACSLCAFCSSDAGTVICCAAQNCSVSFHPMCGVISSFAAELHLESKKHTDEKPSASDDEKASDEFLCTQNTLTMMKLDYVRNNVWSTKTVPVVFCGYHNPKRRADFRGLPPGGRLDERIGVIRAHVISDTPPVLEDWNDESLHHSLQ